MNWLEVLGSSQTDQSLGPDSNPGVDWYQANLQYDTWRGRVGGHHVTKT